MCPAEFDTGAHKNMMILSVPEGEDKPLKYPLMFSVCDLVLISKMDTIEYFDFNKKKAIEYIDKNGINDAFVKELINEELSENSNWCSYEKDNKIDLTI